MLSKFKMATRCQIHGFLWAQKIVVQFFQKLQITPNMEMSKCIFKDCTKFYMVTTNQQLLFLNTNLPKSYIFTGGGLDCSFVNFL